MFPWEQKINNGHIIVGFDLLRHRRGIVLKSETPKLKTRVFLDHTSKINIQFLVGWKPTFNQFQGVFGVRMHPKYPLKLIWSGLPAREESDIYL